MVTRARTCVPFVSLIPHVRRSLCYACWARLDSCIYISPSPRWVSYFFLSTPVAPVWSLPPWISRLFVGVLALRLRALLGVVGRLLRVVAVGLAGLLRLLLLLSPPPCLTLLLLWLDAILGLAVGAADGPPAVVDAVLIASCSILFWPRRVVSFASSDFYRSCCIS